MSGWLKVPASEEHSRACSCVGRGCAEWPHPGHMLIAGARPVSLCYRAGFVYKEFIPKGGVSSSIRQLLGAADTQTAHPATSSTAPAHQLLGSANAETTPARAPAAAADRTQRPDATCEGKNG